VSPADERAPRAASDGEPLPSDPEPFSALEVESSQRLYDSHWCGLRRDMLVLPDGKPQEYHVFEVPNAICVVPVTRDGSIVMIGQYRYPHGKTHWEIPAGRIDRGEAIDAAALREVREETGFNAGRLEALHGFYPINGISDHYVHGFVALDCERDGDPRLDPSERLIVRTFSRAQVEALLDAGRIQDAFSAITLLYYLRRRERA